MRLLVLACLLPAAINNLSCFSKCHAVKRLQRDRATPSFLRPQNGQTHQRALEIIIETSENVFFFSFGSHHRPQIKISPVILVCNHPLSSCALAGGGGRVRRHLAALCSRHSRRHRGENEVRLAKQDSQVETLEFLRWKKSTVLNRQWMSSGKRYF